MRNRYEVIYVQHGTVHVAGRSDTFTGARAQAKQLADKLWTMPEGIHVVSVRDTRNDDAEVWRVTVGSTRGNVPPTDIACHKVEPSAKAAPYPWCVGAPTKAACASAGYCKRQPSCGS